MTACKALKNSSLGPPSYELPPAHLPVPRQKWLLDVYVIDVLKRMVECKAKVTGTFGNILKLDSTKKVIDL